VVDDLGDDSELAGRWPVVDEDHSADLDESLEGGRLRRLLFGLSAQAKVIMWIGTIERDMAQKYDALSVITVD